MLPRIDEHTVVVNAPPQALWEATVEVVGAPRARASGPVATALACADRSATGNPHDVGATFPGFHVVRSHPPSAWALEGEHRFSRYSWSFCVQPVGNGRSRVSAETHAAFPGVSGAIYRALVIDTRIHVVAVRSVLRTIKRTAEQRAASG
jgi:hypothetical protein